MKGVDDRKDDLLNISATLAINEETLERRARGLPVLSLGFGEAGLPVHEDLRQQLASAAGHAAYGPVAGAQGLREAAAGYWQRRGVVTDSEQVVAGPGSKPLLYALLRASGGPVALPQPSWVSYAALAALLDVQVHHIPTLPDQGGVPDPELLDRVARGAREAGAPIRTLVLTLPDNPTGTLATPATVRAVCEVATRHDLTIISDEIYRDLIHSDSTPFLSPVEVAPERTVVTTGLSKSLALGGWRIGVARFPQGPRGRALRATVTSIASEVWSAPAHPVQLAAAWAFTEPECLVERVASSRRLHGLLARAVADEFRAVGVEVPDPKAGFYLYPDFEAHRTTLESRHAVDTGAKLATTLLNDQGIATLPASVFGESEGALRLRVATGLLYGSTDPERDAALSSPSPVELPWVAEQLSSLRLGLTRLVFRDPSDA